MSLHTSTWIGIFSICFKHVRWLPPVFLFFGRDFSYNKDLGGPLPASIGSLSNLENLCATKLFKEFQLSTDFNIFHCLDCSLTYLLSNSSAEFLSVAAFLEKYRKNSDSSPSLDFCKETKATWYLCVYAFDLLATINKQGYNHFLGLYLLLNKKLLPIYIYPTVTWEINFSLSSLVRTERK